jgi:hypothetical protein
VYNEFIQLISLIKKWVTHEEISMIKSTMSMLAQLLAMISRNSFDRPAAEYGTEKHSRGFM